MSENGPATYQVRHGFPDARGLLRNFDTEDAAHEFAKDAASRGYCVGVYGVTPIAAYGEANG